MIGRGLTSLSSPSEKFRTFARQCRCPSIHSVSCSANAGRSRNRWFVSLKTGVVPSIFDRGLIRSIGSSWFPQLSHWSPRADSKPQIGQVPSM